MQMASERQHNHAPKQVQELSKIRKDMIRPADVLLGRGKSVQNYKGNIAFREVVKERRHEFQEQNCIQRDVTCHEIIDVIQGRDGRFLERVKEEEADEEYWIQCSYPTMRLKVRQALRDSLKTSGPGEANNLKTRSISTSNAEEVEQPMLPMKKKKYRRDCPVDFSSDIMQAGAAQFERYVHRLNNDDATPTADSSPPELDQWIAHSSEARNHSKSQKIVPRSSGEYEGCLREGADQDSGNARARSLAGAAELSQFDGGRDVTPLEATPVMPLQPEPVGLRTPAAEPQTNTLTSLYQIGQASNLTLSGVVPQVQTLQPFLRQPPSSLWREIPLRDPATLLLSSRQNDAYVNYLLRQQRALREALAALDSSNHGGRLGQRRP